MKYHRIKPYSYCWLKWLYILYALLFFSVIASYVITRKTIMLSGFVVIAFAGIVCVVVARRTGFYDS